MCAAQLLSLGERYAQVLEAPHLLKLHTVHLYLRFSESVNHYFTLVRAGSHPVCTRAGFEFVYELLQLTVVARH